MKKKLIALAVAGAFVAPAAMADNSNVTIYGKIDMGFGETSNGATSTNQVASNTTYLGLKGNEDLGDGLYAIWQIEQQIDIDNSSANPNSANKFATRDSFAGLKGDSWGTMLLGRHDSPYKSATRRLDAFGDQLADNRSMMGGAYNQDGGPGDVVAYISPNLSGFTGAAAYVAGAETAAFAGSVKGSSWSFAGMYDVAPFYGGLAYQTTSYGSAATGTLAAPGGFAANDKLNAWKLGLGYTFMEALQLNAIYEKISSSGTIANVVGQTDWYLAGVYKFGNDDVKLAYGHAGNSVNTSNTGAKQWSLGYDHNMSKHSTLYAQYTKVNNDANAVYSIFGASTAGGFAASAPGVSPYGYMVGVKYFF